MKLKLISFSDKEINLIEKEALEEERSFTETVRRIVDKHFEDRKILTQVEE